MLERLESLLRGPEPRAQALLTDAPSAARALLELGFVLLLLFAVGPFAELAGASLLLGTLACSLPLWIYGGLLLRPLQSFARGQRRLAVASVLGLLLLVPAVVAIQLTPEGHSQGRLGLQLSDVAAGSVDDGIAGGVAEVNDVVPESPAAGVVEVGDRIIAFNGEALAAAHPASDVANRSRDAKGALEIELQVLRGGQRLNLNLQLGPAPDPDRFELRGSAFFYWLTARNLCVLALVLLLVYKGGQSARQIGFAREGLRTELLAGPRVLLGAYLVHLAVSVPLGVLSYATGFGREDAVQRSGFLSQLGEGVGFVDLAFFLVLAAAFEEVVFRGFLLTRLHALVRRWSVAVLLAACIFGVAHTAQGMLAILQTGALGMYFAAAFLRRSRAEAVVVAHASFNLLIFLALFWLIKSGWLERAQQLLDR